MQNLVCVLSLLCLLLEINFSGFKQVGDYFEALKFIKRNSESIHTKRFVKRIYFIQGPGGLKTVEEKVKNGNNKFSIRASLTNLGNPEIYLYVSVVIFIFHINTTLSFQFHVEIL